MFHEHLRDHMHANSSIFPSTSHIRVEALNGTHHPLFIRRVLEFKGKAMWAEGRAPAGGTGTWRRGSCV